MKAITLSIRKTEKDFPTYAEMAQNIVNTMKYMDEGLEKIRSKKWSGPLGIALSATGNIANALSSAGVPFVGILGGTLKFASSVLNPAPTLKDLKKMKVEIEEALNDANKITKNALLKELEDVKKQIQAPQGELVEDFDLMKREIQSSANDIVNDMRRIEEELDSTKSIIHKTYDLVVDIRFKDGIEKIDSAYNVFLNGSNNLEHTFSEMQNYSFELMTIADQSFSPQRIRNYFSAMKVTNDSSINQEVGKYILVTHTKLLQILISYFLFNQEFDRAANELQRFNSHYSQLCDIFKDECQMDFLPQTPSPSLEAVKIVVDERNTGT